MHKKTGFLFLLVFVCGLQASDLHLGASAPKCSTAALSTIKKQELEQYILKKYKLTGSTSVKVIGEHMDPRINNPASHRSRFYTTRCQYRTASDSELVYYNRHSECRTTLAPKKVL
ncbi:MAG: hypothetical protein ACRD22_17215 [Terriglobia bacterium]